MSHHARLLCILLVGLSGACLEAQTVGQEESKAAVDATQESARDIRIGRGLPLAELEQLDGSPAADTVSLQRWRQAVFEMRQGARRELGWPSGRALRQQSLLQKQTMANGQRLSLALLHARYEQESPASSLGQSPTDSPTQSTENTGAKRQTRTVFAFSPLQLRTFHGADFEMLLEPDAYLRHAVEPAAELWLDAGDGLGLRPLVPSEGLPVSYQTTGPKTLTLQARMPNGDVLQSSAQLEVAQLVTPDPDDTWNIVASETYDGIAGSGSAYIYLADGHATVTNPVVIVEGFDIDNSLGWPELYDLLNRENLLENLRAAGYDAVVLDFTDAVDSIQRNAFVLTELLQQVNAVTAADQSSVIVGASMGGLVSRYALLWMEDQAIDHRVRKLISFDSPQNGANIPLGLQAWVEFFADQAEEAAFLLNQLRSPASKQMLLYHLDGVAANTANADPLFGQMHSELISLGGWPAEPRLVSVINGSGMMLGQSFSPGEQLIEWDYNSLLVNVDGDVWAVPDGGSQQIFDGRISILFVSNTTDSLTISGTIPWDNSPGGSRPSLQQAADVNAPYGDIIALHERHSFIPTVSALALNTDDPFYDVDGDAQLMEHTPFHTVYYPEANQEHIEITAENKLWFMAEVQAQIIVSMISGDTTESGGTATFTITPLTAPSQPVTIALSSSHPGEGSVPVEVVLPAASTTPQVVTVTGVDDDVTDGDIAYTIITAVSVSGDPSYHGIDPADVSVLNLDNDVPEELIFKDGFETP